MKGKDKFYYTKYNTFSKVNNGLPENFKNKIICGNSLDVLKTLPDNCVDLVITSPPYNLNMNYNEYEDEIDWNDYFNNLFLIFDEVIRVVKFSGRIIINIEPAFSDYIPSHHIISNYFMSKKLIWKSEILWEKNNYNCKFCSFGSWKSPSMPYMKYTWEFLEVFCKGTLKKEGKKEDIDITADEFKSWLVSKWSIAPERNMKNYQHPAMFPEKLVERCLKLFSYQNDVILDPFNGAGTTTYVATKLNRNYLGIDISEKYCATARRRTELSF